MLADIEDLPTNSIIFLHSCGHPTGVDPTKEEWIKITEMFKIKGHYPYVNVEFQGLISGDMAQDTFPLRYFLAEGEQY